jgi:hypothetical protein
MKPITTFLDESKHVASQESGDAVDILISKDEYDWLVAKLNEPTCEIPQLRRILDESSVFENEPPVG